MIYSLTENFKMKFSDFHGHVWNIRIFENPFSVEVIDATEKLKLEFIELQYDLLLSSSFN